MISLCHLRVSVFLSEDGEGEMLYPFSLTFVSSIVVTIFMMFAAAYIFCKHDMKQGMA